MFLVDLKGISIFEQLQLEEALLRTDTHEWCLVNCNAPNAIVMGISGQPNRLLNLDLLKKNPIPLIKRYSGGGTVVVDPSTIFVTFICNSDSRGVAPFPKEIMKWSETMYRPFFRIPAFGLRENDYVLGDKKFGGNAQYIQKQRWVHHTSFLWDFAHETMNYLLLPEKRPVYRQDRSHLDFLCRLSELYPNKESFYSDLKAYLQSHFPKEVSYASLSPILETPHRKNTVNISLD